MRKEGNTVSPTFYLESFYKEYENGKAIEDIIGELADGFVRYGLDESPDFAYLSSFEGSRDRIMLKVVNYKKNAGLLGLLKRLSRRWVLVWKLVSKILDNSANVVV